ncbi:TatD family hydrolase [Methanococcus voltae]|uniref:TatD family hydrolase n=1 Tax=Methanococcus voltae TaxID=2188 RepID=UPI00015EC51E|nr:TatD family hydrolase [Methanococcus voltae]MCS3900596.1 TatD DNase family protein [Methanococcus voltae]
MKNNNIDNIDNTNICNSNNKNSKNIYYIDAHCHMEYRRLKNRDEVINRAINNNVRMITSGESLGGCKRALELKKKYPKDIDITMGYHPSRIKSDWKVVEDTYKFIEKNQDLVVAVGEIGLDSGITAPTDIQKQEKIFRKYLNLAMELDKPIVIHARGFEDKAYDIIQEITKNDLKIIYHCFSGSKQLAEELINNDNYISISTQLCFSDYHKNLITELLNKYGMDLFKNTLSETDSPFVSPVKGEQNEPLNVIKVMDEFGKIYNSVFDSTNTKNNEYNCNVFNNMKNKLDNNVINKSNNPGNHIINNQEINQEINQDDNLIKIAKLIYSQTKRLFKI